MASAHSMLLEKLLTPNDARSCTGPWAAEIIKFIEEDPSVLITPVNEKIPLEVFILQLKNLTNDLCQDSQENVKIVFKALTNGLSVKFKNKKSRTPMQVLVTEMTSFSPGNSKKSVLQLYIDAIEVVASCVHNTCDDSSDTLGACLYDLVATSKEFRQSFPVEWLKSIRVLLKYGASRTYRRYRRSTALDSLICELVESTPWSNEEFRNSYMEGMSLLASPDLLEEAIRSLAYAGCNMFKTPGCAETVNEVLDRLLDVDEDSKRFLGMFMFLVLQSGMAFKAVHPCNSAWADIVEYSVTRGADITYIHSDGPLRTTALHALMAIPVSVKDPTDENVHAFSRVLNLLVSVGTVNLTDVCGTTPLQALKSQKAQACSDGHRKMFHMAKEKFTSCFSWPQQLNCAVQSTFKEDFVTTLNDDWVEDVRMAVDKCKENSCDLLWQDANGEKNTALLWLLMVVDELFPYPSQKHKDVYMKVLKQLQVPELMFVENKFGHTPLDSVILTARDALQVSDDLGFYEDVIVTMLDHYIAMNTDSKLFSKSLGYLIAQYTLVSQPAMRMYFKVFDRLVEYGAKVSYNVWKKYFIDIDTQDSLKFHGMAASHTKPYVLLVKKIIEALDENDCDVEHPFSFTWGFSHLVNLYVIPPAITHTISYIQDQVVEKCMQSCGDFIILLKAAMRNKSFEKLPEILKAAVPSSWMNRNALHILAMLCNEKAIYETLNKYCPNEVSQLIDGLDLHGGTPYMLAVVYENIQAAEFFLNCGMSSLSMDNFGCSADALLRRNRLSWDPVQKSLRTDKGQQTTLCDFLYFEENCATLRSIQERDWHGKMPVPTIPEGQSKVQNLVELFFSRMAEYLVKKHPWLECKLRMAGSIGEKTKIGRTDEFDIQFIFTAISDAVEILHIGNSNVATVQLKHGELEKMLPEDVCFEQGNLNVQAFGKILHTELINSLTAENVCQLPIRVVKTSNPWLLVWENNDTRKGLEISIDIVPIIQIAVDIVEKSLGAKRGNHSSGTPEEYNPKALRIKQGKIIENARARPMKLFLRWGRPGREHRLVPTIADFERDLIDSMHLEIRCGIKIVKSLLEIAYWVDGAYYADADKPITSYMIKNATFWLVKESIDGTVPESLVDELGRLSEVMLLAKSGFNLYQSLQDSAMHIPGKLLEDYPKSLSLVSTDMNHNYAASDEWMKTTLNSVATLGALPDKIKNKEKRPKKCQVSRSSSGIKKFLAPPVVDDAFAVIRKLGIDIKHVEREAGLFRNIRDGKFSGKESGECQRIEKDDDSSSRRLSPGEQEDTVANAGIAWALKIVKFIEGQTRKQYGLPIYYSSDAKPDFLTNKWNRDSIGKMCETLLDWLVLLLEQ